MERRLSLSPAGQGLVVGEDDVIVLCVGLVGAGHHPGLVGVEGRVVPADVVAEHVDVRAAVGHPSGHLVPTAAPQHHASAVEATAVVEALDVGVLS